MIVENHSHISNQNDILYQIIDRPFIYCLTAWKWIFAPLEGSCAMRVQQVGLKSLAFIPLIPPTLITGLVKGVCCFWNKMHHTTQEPLDPANALSAQEENPLLQEFPGSDLFNNTTLTLPDTMRALLEENQKPTPSYAKYVRRFPPQSCHDTWGKEMHRTGRFIADEEILAVHPMQCLRPSPYLGITEDNITDYQSMPPDMQESFVTHCQPRLLVTWRANLNAIAQMCNGKHILLQQATRSCVPTAIFMLILDTGKQPKNWTLSATTNLSTLQKDQHLLEEVGLPPLLRRIVPQPDLLTCLQTYLQEHGPGVLDIDDPVIGGHVIVVDAVNTIDQTVQIRDPFHGWALTIRSERLLCMLSKSSQLLQINSDQVR